MNGVRIRAYRHRLDWSQDILAEKAKMSRSYLAEIERGSKIPRRLVAESIAEALGVDVTYLIESPGVSAEKQRNKTRQASSFSEDSRAQSVESLQG